MRILDILSNIIHAYPLSVAERENNTEKKYRAIVEF